MENKPDFQLLVTEGFRIEEPCSCARVKAIKFGYGVSLLVRIDPPYPGQTFRISGAKQDFLLLSPTFQGDSLFPVNKWPMHVHIAVPLIEDVELRDRLEVNEALNYALGTIYLSNDREGNKPEKL